MSQSPKHVNTRVRMLAFLLLLALFVTIGIPQGNNAIAGGGNNNDTLTSTPITDSIEGPLTEQKLYVSEMSFKDWLIVIASMLL